MSTKKSFHQNSLQIPLPKDNHDNISHAQAHKTY
jgi:hypothetical protein